MITDHEIFTVNIIFFCWQIPWMTSLELINVPKSTQYTRKVRKGPTVYIEIPEHTETSDHAGIYHRSLTLDNFYL